MAHKITKQATLYLYKKGTDYECKDCNMFISNKERCTIHGKNDVIKPWGSCGFFIYGKPVINEDPHSAVTKKESGYVENPSKDGYSCKRCEYFLPEKYDCRIVDKSSDGDNLGIIHPDGCCNAWERREEDSSSKLLKVLKLK